MRRAQPERAFQNAVIEYARIRGWRTYHPPENRPTRSTGRVQPVTPGFPDLTLVRHTRLVFAELKAKTGRVTAEQREWLLDLSATGAETHIWKPKDWDEIERVLA